MPPRIPAPPPVIAPLAPPAPRHAPFAGVLDVGSIDPTLPLGSPIVAADHETADPGSTTASMKVPDELLRKSIPTLPPAALEEAQPTGPMVPAHKGSPRDYVGTILGSKYHVTGLLGVSPANAVLRAEQLEIGKPVAIKVLLDSDYQDDPDGRRLKREARAAVEARHPGLVDVFDWGFTSDSRPYFVMELLEGESVAARLAKGPVAPHEAARIAQRVASALDALHRAGYVHRDVKPSNIMLVRDDESGRVTAKLIDMGIVRRVQGASGDAHSLRHKVTTRINGLSVDQTLPSVILGTVRYMSPEQATGQKLDGRSDVYSLAAVLYEMLAGTPPFRQVRTIEVIAAHLMDEPELPSVRAPDAGIPKALEEVVMRGLRKEPARRFESAAEMAEALRECLPTDPTRKLPVAKPAPAGRRTRLILPLAAFAGAAAASAVALSIMTRTTAPVAQAPEAPIPSAPVQTETTTPGPAPVPEVSAAEPPSALSPVTRPHAVAKPGGPLVPQRVPDKQTTPSAGAGAKALRLDDLKDPFRK